MAKKTKKPTKAKTKFRSKFEETVAETIDAEYEPIKIKFTQPAKDRTYTPDFRLKNGILVETKGLLRDADARAKMILVKNQHPDLDIRFVFQNPQLLIYKGSPTTYAAWANKNGFKWSSKVVPQEWIDEPSKAVGKPRED